MSGNSIFVDRSVDEVRDLALRPAHYSYWVVGPQVVDKIDPTWPGIGSGFTTKIGRGPLTMRGRTTLVSSGASHLSLRVDLRPFLVASVHLSFTAEGKGTRVTLEERALGGLMTSGGPGTDLLMRLRNQESLRRFRSLLEGRGGVASSLWRARLSGEAVFSDPQIKRVLDAASICYVAVGSASGPHVTPARFVTWGDRLWTVVGASSVKSKVAKKRPTVGVTAHSGAAHVVVQGDAVILDPADPMSLLRGLSETAVLPPAMFRYLTRNLGEAGEWAKALAGAFAPGSAGGRPVLMAIRPRAGLIRGGDDDRAFGGWTGAFSGEKPPHPGGSWQVMGWANDQGPLALPVSWMPQDHRVLVDAELVWITGGRADSKACLLLDEAEEHVGMMLRGEGSLLEAGDSSALRLDTSRLTFWDGTSTGTVKLGA